MPNGMRRIVRERLRGGKTLLVLLLHNPLSMSPGEESPRPSSTLSVWWQTYRYPQVYLQPAKPLFEAVESLLSRTPLVPHQQPELQGKELLRAVGPSVACFLATLRYVSSVPRGLLGWLSTSASSTQAPCGLGKGKSKYGFTANDNDI
jgi:hypothetical protein